MNHPIIAWQTPPSPTELRQFPHAQHLLVCLPDAVLPDWSSEPVFQAALSCVQFSGANVLNHVLPHAHQTLWLLPPAAASQLSDFFGQRPIHWQNGSPPPQTSPSPQHHKMWFRQPENLSPPQHVIVIGAGIAGASTAYELARRGVSVTVLDQAPHVASAASGNRQALLYAKISPHPTAQTELLLCAYGYARRQLAHLLPKQQTWGATGILHLNHDPAETKRHLALVTQTWHRHLYQAVCAEQASELAGIPLSQAALFWQHGCWLNPRAFIEQLLSHEAIHVRYQHQLYHAQHDGQHWHLHTNHGILSATHIVFCTGAGSLKTSIIEQFPLQIIRGQTSLVEQSLFSGSLKMALSGASYLTPAWQGVHTFGATFLPNQHDDTWQTADELSNQQALQQLHPSLHQSLTFTNHLRGHAALRCDAHDHLPVVGALGQPEAMRHVYAKLALDKHYRLNSPCPYYPNAFVNTAHGSRGLTTAPLCAAYVAALICDEPLPISRHLQTALHPNRLIIRNIVRHIKN